MLKSRREAAIVEVSEDVERADGGAHRVRSGALLAGFLTCLGVATAAVLGVLAVAVAALMDQALG